VYVYIYIYIYIYPNQPANTHVKSRDPLSFLRPLSIARPISTRSPTHRPGAILFFWRLFSPKRSGCGSNSWASAVGAVATLWRPPREFSGGDSPSLPSASPFRLPTPSSADRLESRRHGRGCSDASPGRVSRGGGGGGVFADSPRAHTGEHPPHMHFFCPCFWAVHGWAGLGFQLFFVDFSSWWWHADHLFVNGSSDVKSGEPRALQICDCLLGHTIHGLCFCF
jgi:hypothetical protein